MHLKRLRNIIVMGMLCYLPFTSGAWSLMGHRIVGEIADSYLTKKSRKAIADILGKESVAMSANWMDFIKSDPSYNYLYNWHFINLRAGLSETDIESYLVTDTTTDAYTKINFCIAQLKNRSVLSLENRQLYLRVLIHVIGDIHQPMHTGHFEDLGGNKIKVLWFSIPTNLHSVWDDKLIESQDLSFTEYATAINYTNKQQRREWQAEPISKWVTDSYNIAQKLYADVTMPDQKLDYKYNFNYLDIVNHQLLKAGVHLAGVLNDIFD